MLTPWDELLYTPSSPFSTGGGYRHYPPPIRAVVAARPHYHHPRHYHHPMELALHSSSSSPSYGGLLSNVLNEGFRQLQQMERELGHVLNTADSSSIQQQPSAEDGGQLQVERDGGSNASGGGGYKFSCSVAGYAPEELSVDLQGDELLITGEHRADGDGQSIHRQFTRRVVLPQSVNKESITCSIDDRGVLEVCAKPKALEPAQEKLNIPIGFKESDNASAIQANQHTGIEQHQNQANGTAGSGGDGGHQKEQKLAAAARGEAQKEKVAAGQ